MAILAVPLPAEAKDSEPGGRSQARPRGDFGAGRIESSSPGLFAGRRRGWDALIDQAAKPGTHGRGGGRSAPALPAQAASIANRLCDRARALAGVADWTGYYRAEIYRGWHGRQFRGSRFWREDRRDAPGESGARG